MKSTRKERIETLLKGLETGDPASVAVVSPERYIQHNPQTHEGDEGLAALFERLSKTNPRVNLVRVFADGDYVFAHTEYFFSSARVGFEVFRFEDELAVEHWDNIQPRKGPSPSGHSMVDGTVDLGDSSATETSREVVRTFVEDVLVHRNFQRLGNYVSAESFIEHNPRIADGHVALRTALSGEAPSIRYEKLHRVLAEGDFALSVSEGSLDGLHSAFYDLFRVSNRRLVEHWDTTEGVAPRSEWKNNNGKF